MSHSLSELAALTRVTISERLRLGPDGQWQFTTPTGGQPARIATLRNSGVTTREVLEQYPELTAVDVKVARIVSYLTTPSFPAVAELLHNDEHRELVMRLNELAALLHEGRGCCEISRALR